MTDSEQLRPTPIHLLFPDGMIDAARLEAIRTEVSSGGHDSWNPMAVATLPSVSAWVSEVRPGGDDPHAIHAYASLVFYALHTLSEHGAVFVVPEGVARGLAVRAPSQGADWSASPPSAAGYVQLPQNVFWAHTDQREPSAGETESTPADAAAAPEHLAEPVDGIFWAHKEDGIWVLLACGLRPGRPGFSAVALDRLPARDIGVWADTHMRDEGTDFENLLPGGDLAGFLTVGTAGEALKLLARVWRHAEWYGTRTGTAAASADSASQDFALTHRVLNPPT